MAISYVGAGNVLVGGGTLTMPAGISSGDLILIVSTSTYINNTTICAQGWRPLLQTAQQRVQLFYKFATGFETSFIPTNTQSVTVAIAYRGVGAIDGLSSQLLSNTGPLTVPSATTLAANEIVLCMAGIPANNITITGDASYTDIVNQSGVAGINSGLYIGSKTQATAGSTGTATITLSGSSQIEGFQITLADNSVSRVYECKTNVGTGSSALPANFKGNLWAEVIGGGGSGFKSATGAGGAGGGGAAYSNSVSITGFSANSSIYWQVGSATQGSWIATSNAQPAVKTAGVYADFGKNAGGSRGVGGAVASCVGDYRSPGHSGGNGGSAAGGGSGGGGAAAIPTYVSSGSNDDAGYAGNSGGGGAGGGSAVSPSPNPSASPNTTTNGGAGSVGPANSAGGLGATPTTAAGNGSNASGGGGAAKTVNIAAGNGGDVLPIWQQTSDNTVYGPGGGGGGGSAASGSAGGNGGVYGGAGGGVYNLGTSAGVGAQGLVVYSYIISGTARESDFFHLLW